MIFLRRQAIQEERGLVSRVALIDSNTKQGVQIDHYQDQYGCFSNITYLTKTPLTGKNIHNRARTPRPAYDLSIRLRCERRKENQQYRNQQTVHVQQTTNENKITSYSVYITQQSMPKSWKS